jgi:anthranilate phosphoribosyltransferase
MLDKLIRGESLSAEEVFEVVLSLLDDPLKMAGFLILLKAKGETPDEILGLVRAMRSKMKKVYLDAPVLDIVGTGGDLAGTVNISTGSALMVAKCGVPVVKHGNRAVSSKCGSADVLEALGVDIHQPVGKENFSFCFAPDYHPIMKEMRALRKALKVPTAFNLIGPLLNPAGTDHLQIGVYNPELVPVIAEVLFKLGTKRSLVFSGHGIDELSCIGPTEAILVTEEGVEPLLIDPEQLGLHLCTLEELKGGDAKMNAEILRNPPRAVFETLVLNAGVALFLYGKVETIAEGVQMVNSFKNRIRNRGVIAEIKRASPSMGKIGEIKDPAERAMVYEASGAAAISVLTSDRFEGSLEDLKRVRSAVSIPVLRKDFILTKEQLAETDADAVLLIVSYLKERTQEMLQAAREMGFEAIVEIHNAEELKIALAAGADIIGVNQRDLRDFSIHPEVYELIHQIPKEIVKIAESGVRDASDAKRLFEMGYDVILVGEALTRSIELCEELCKLKSVV